MSEKHTQAGVIDTAYFEVGGAAESIEQGLREELRDERDVRIAALARLQAFEELDNLVRDHLAGVVFDQSGVLTGDGAELTALMISLQGDLVPAKQKFYGWRLTDLLFEAIAYAENQGGAQGSGAA